VFVSSCRRVRRIVLVPLIVRGRVTPPHESHKQRSFAATSVKSGESDSNRYLRAGWRGDLASLYARVVGRGEATRTRTLPLTLLRQPNTASGRTVMFPLPWRSTT
jgi:hypothetical protein